MSAGSSRTARSGVTTTHCKLLPLAIDHLNQRLKEKLLEMQRRLQDLEQENAAMKDSTQLDWFIRGAGVLLGGIILGLVLPRVRVRKRANWETF